MAVADFRGPGPAEARWREIEALATSLSAKRLARVGGLRAGIEHRAGEGAFAARPVAASTPDAPAKTTNPQTT